MIAQGGEQPVPQGRAQPIGQCGEYIGFGRGDCVQMGQGIDFEPVGGARPLPPSIEAGLFRMAQEALTNATRHSRASSVILRLVTTPQEVELSVEDNGRGFDPTASPGDRYGLVGINERATLLGGRMSLESSEGVGTRLEIRVPLPPSGPGVR